MDNDRVLRTAGAILPAVVAVAAIEIGHRSGVQVPIPFLLVFAAVVFGGAAGGRVAGILAGAIAAALVAHSYLIGFGPPTLTGGAGQALGGMAAFVATGYLLGRISDRSTEATRMLRESSDREKRALAAALETSQTRYEQALDVANIGIWIWNIDDQKIEYCSEINAAMVDMTPAEFIEVCGTGDFGQSMVHPDSLASYQRAIDQVLRGATVHHEYAVMKRDGAPVYLRETLAPIRDEHGRIVKLMGTCIDLTELRQTEMQLRQTQKMEAIGRLTAGVAHDFNNLLAVILGNLELLKARVADTDVAGFVAEALRATARGASLTKQLLVFGRRAALEPEIVDANAVIRGMDELFRRTLPATIEVDTVLSGGLWSIEVDRAQLESALLNLVINARDAMPDGGKLTIETANIRLDEAYCTDRGDEVAPGRYLQIAVSDTGKGMTADELGHAFEPFFTTKPQGEGSGLGLAMVWGFLRQSGGNARIYSEPGHGTTVKLHFPEKAGAAPRRERPQAPAPADAADDHRILLVEDTDDVRRVLALQLAELGYSVAVAENGERALEVLRSGRHIDLMLTDVVMPGELQGPELGKAASAEFPDLRIVYMSGYPKSAVENGNGATLGAPKLTKPIGMAELGEVLARELARRC